MTAVDWGGMLCCAGVTLALLALAAYMGINLQETSMEKMLGGQAPPAEKGASHGEFTSLTIRKEGCDTSIHMTPEGIWVSKGSSVASSIQLQDGLPVVTVMDHRKREQGGHQIALSVDKDGAPCLQIVHGKKGVYVSGDELLKLFEKETA